MWAPEGDHRLHVPAGARPRSEQKAPSARRRCRVSRSTVRSAVSRSGRRQRLRGHALEGLDLVEPLQRVRVEPGVAHRGGGGGGDGGGQLDLVGRELAPRPRHARDDPDGARVEEDGNQHRRSGRPRPRTTCGSAPARPACTSGTTSGCWVSKTRPARPSPTLSVCRNSTGWPDVPVSARRVSEARAGVEEPDADDVDAEPRLGHVGEALEHLPQIEGGGDQPARFGEDLELTRPRNRGTRRIGRSSEPGYHWVFISLGDRAASSGIAVTATFPS